MPAPAVFRVDPGSEPRPEPPFSFLIFVFTWLGVSIFGGLHRKRLEEQDEQEVLHQHTVRLWVSEEQAMV